MVCNALGRAKEGAVLSLSLSSISCVEISCFYYFDSFSSSSIPSVGEIPASVCYLPSYGFLATTVAAVAVVAAKREKERDQGPGRTHRASSRAAGTFMIVGRMISGLAWVSLATSMVESFACWRAW